jgi:4-amino-4-deoxy-L-arabinose transferase-like glycosyltransferase
LSGEQDAAASLPTRDLLAFRALLVLVAVLAAGHTVYLVCSSMVPSADEAYYLSGALQIERGMRASPAATWQAWVGALVIKPPMASMVAAVAMLIGGEGPLQAYLSLIAVFLLLCLSAWALLRRCLDPFGAACGVALLATMPMVTGLTHRFYVEGILLACAMGLLALLLNGAFERSGRALLAGVVLGCGLLCKLTFAPLLGPPCVYLLIARLRSPPAQAIRGRDSAGVVLRAAILVASGGAIAAPWFLRNSRPMLEHARAAANCAECRYPEVGSLLANLSAGPSILLTALALGGLCSLVTLLRRGGVDPARRRAFLSILLLGATTLAMTTASSNKATRFFVTALPAFAALTGLAIDRLAHSRPRGALAGAAAVGASTLLAAHNSFALPLPTLRIGDLRLVDRAFPLNIPGWFDDNHPLDRRRWGNERAERMIADDLHRERRGGGLALAALTAHGLLVNHDYYNFVAELKRDPVSFTWWPAVDLAGHPPDYVVQVNGFRDFHPGVHYHDNYPGFAAQVAAGRLDYQLIGAVEEQPGARLEVYRRRQKVLFPENPAVRDKLIVEAERFVQGNGRVDTDNYGKGIGVVVSAGAITRLEYRVPVQAAGRHEIALRCASAEPRPFRLSIDGKVVSETAAGGVTGGFGAEAQAWQSAGTFDLAAGLVTLSLERSGPICHLDKIAIGPPVGGPGPAPAQGSPAR